MDDLRAACARVAERAAHVTIVHEAIGPYARGVVHPRRAPRDPDDTPREEHAAAVLTLDAINFGSGWFPELRKRDGLSGYNTIAAAWRAQPPPTARALMTTDARQLAHTLGQDPEHELMALYAASLRDLAGHVIADHDHSFVALATWTDSAVTLARRLGSWSSFADTSRYGSLEIPFLKRAQIAAADLARAGVVHFADLDRLTMFADNLVPHVLRLDGVLRLDPSLVARIERGERIVHGSPEEVEIRACALHAVELIATAHPGAITAAEVDECLWNRGQQPRYKAVPRHRSRCTAY
jgi:putative queuosine salvage protein